jgi:hypothetical protein
MSVPVPAPFAEAFSPEPNAVVTFTPDTREITRRMLPAVPVNAIEVLSVEPVPHRFQYTAHVQSDPAVSSPRATRVQPSPLGAVIVLTLEFVIVTCAKRMSFVLGVPETLAVAPVAFESVEIDPTDSHTGGVVAALAGLNDVEKAPYAEKNEHKTESSDIFTPASLRPRAPN